MNNPNKITTHPKTVGAAIRRNEALRHRLSGLTFAEIAEKMGIARQTAHEYVKKALELTMKEQSELADEVRELTKSRLDALLAAHWTAATEERDAKSADLVLKLIDRQAKLFGLDAPVKSVQAHMELSEMSQDELEQQARTMGIDLSGLMPASDEVKDLETLYEGEREDESDE